MTHQVIAVICPTDERFDDFTHLLRSRVNSVTVASCAVDGHPVHLASLTGGPTLLVVRPDDVWSNLLDQQDGVIVILDGDRGLDKATQTLWDAACDSDLPRLVLAPDAHSTRADFDEVVAIVQRVLEPDALIRFLPINGEDTEDYVGLFDLVTNDIRAYSEDGTVSIIAPDHEHLELTNEQRESFIDELAHVVLDDEALEKFEQGLPINMARLRDEWNSDDVVTVLPLTQRLGIDLVSEWIDARSPRIEPVWQFEHDSAANAGEVSEGLYGVAIAPRVIRLWGTPIDGTQVNQLVQASTGVLIELIAQTPDLAITSSPVTVGSSWLSKESDDATRFLILPELL